MIKRLDLENASVNELLVLTEMLIDVLVEHGDVDPKETVINITVNKPGAEPRVVADVTAAAILERLRTAIDETA